MVKCSSEMADTSASAAPQVVPLSQAVVKTEKQLAADGPEENVVSTVVASVEETVVTCTAVEIVTGDDRSAGVNAKVVSAPVKMVKLEPEVVQVSTATDLQLIVPDSVSQAVDNLENQPVPRPENVVNVNETPKTFKSPPTRGESFKPTLTSTPTVNRVETNVLMRPSRNKLLTSNILSAEEIIKEFVERSEKKRPHQLPEGGDLIFQKQITKRLAEKIVKEDTLNPNISLEMFTPPPAPKLPKLEGDHPDMDAQMLLQILEEGAESHYPEPAKPAKLPKFKRPEVDKELEKEMALKQLMEVSQSRKRRTADSYSSSPKSDQKPKKRLMSEVQRLLQDEGAINMLYAMEKGEVAKATTLPSKRRMKKALMKKAQEVSQAILGGSTLNKGPRLRHPTDVKIKKDPDDGSEIKVRKEGEVQTESKVVNHDESSKISFAAPSPTPGASKIIRRHSSSSSYSGNNSPTRRISLDEAKSDIESRKPVENGVKHSNNQSTAVKSSAKVSQNSTPPVKLGNDKARQVKLVKKSLNVSQNSASKKNESVNGTKKKIVKNLKSKNNSPVAKTSPKVVKVKTVVTKEATKVIDNTNKNSADAKDDKPSNKVENQVPEKTGINKTAELPDQNGFKEKLQTEFTNKLKTMMVRQGLLTKGETPKKPTLKTVPDHSNAVPRAELDKQLLTDNKTIACEAIWQMLQDDWNMGDDPDDPPSPFEGPSFLDSPSVSMISEVETLKPLAMPLKNEIAPLPAAEPELDVIPENKNEVPFSHHLGSNSFMYKELMLRKIGPLVHVNIAPISTHLPQAFNVQVLKELTSVLESCGSDQRCRCLLLTSSGSLFSSGVDLPCLLASDPVSRSTTAKTIAQAVKDFALKLGMFSKMVVAGVSGPCIGLGVAMLPLCDVVISSPRSVFLTPYSSFGYIPEAAATVTLPSVVGHRMASSMLIGGRKLTAQEALNCGLVSQILAEENFTSQVLETAFSIATQSGQSMESTKALLMHSVRSRLSSVLATECALLQQHWLTHDCQLRIKDKAEKLLNE